MNRRNFFGVIGFGTTCAVAGVGGQLLAAKWMTDARNKADVIKQIDENGHNNITFTRTYGTLKKNSNVLTMSIWNTSAPEAYEPGTFKKVDVKFAAGPDGNLYLHQNGKWGKVVVES